jgi:hypothetical protein
MPQLCKEKCGSECWRFTQRRIRPPDQH